MAYQVTLRMQNGVERDLACYGYECHIAHSDRPDIGRIIAAHMEVCQKLGTADYLPVEGDLIALTFESTDHDNFFYEWLLQGSMANGEIEFATGDDIVDIFRFWDCYCVSLEETLCTREVPMLMTVLLSPGILKRMNCEPREKVWKVSDISVKPRVVDNDEKQEIFITDAYWIDENNAIQKDSFPDIPFTLYVKVDTPIVGKRVDLNFKFDDSGTYKCAKYSGIINSEGIIVIKNFKFETVQYEEN